jgi:hypothetical protein
MNLEIWLDQILPEGSILYKHNHGLFDFYRSEDEFTKGEAYFSQDCREDFSSFMQKLIKKIVDEEQANGDMDPSTSIDFAIWGRKDNPNWFNEGTVNPIL